MATIFPNTIKFKSILAETDINVVSNVEALSGKREIITGEISKQIISLTTTPLSESEDRQFQVFLNSIKYYGSFNMPLSDKTIYKPIITTAKNTMNVIGSTIQGLTQFTVEEATGTSLALGIGSFVQFDYDINTNQSTPTKKLYQVINISTVFLNTGGLDRYIVTLDQAVKIEQTSNIKMYYNDLIGQFNVLDGNFNKAVSVLSSTGEQYITYRFKLIEVL